MSTQSTGAGGTYRLCGWRIRSDIALPELAAAPSGDADVAVCLRDHLPALPDPVRCTPFLSIAPDGTAQLSLENLATFRIERGMRISIAPAAGADMDEIRVFLFGAVFGILCHQRGLLPLHAALVQMGDRAIAIAGHSGMGKSTLATALAARGHTLLGDDIAPIAVGVPPMAWPSIPRVKLWEASLTALGMKRDGLAINRRGQSKFQLPTAVTRGDPVPLSAVLVLAAPGSVGPDAITPLTATASLVALLEHVYRRQAVPALGRSAELHAQLSSLAGAIGVAMLRYRRDFTGLDGVLDLIEAWAGQTERG